MGAPGDQVREGRGCSGVHLQEGFSSPCCERPLNGKGLSKLALKVLWGFL